MLSAMAATSFVAVFSAEWYGSRKLGFPVRFKAAHLLAMLTGRPMGWRGDPAVLRLQLAVNMEAAAKTLRPFTTLPVFMMGDSQVMFLHDCAPLSASEKGFFQDSCMVHAALEHVSAAKSAAIVVIHVGTTDLSAGTPRSEMLQEFGRLLDCLQDQFVVVLLPQPVNDVLVSQSAMPGPITNAALSRLRREMKGVCRGRSNVVTVDLAPRIVDSSGNVPPEMLVDPIHFTPHVYRIWRDVIREVIAKRGRKRG